MTVTLDSTGLHIQTYAEILEEIIVAISSGLALSAAQTQRLRDTVEGGLNQQVRQEAERESAMQEGLLAVYNTLSLETTGVPLERIARLQGLTRKPAVNSLVSASLVGTAATVIAAGRRVQFDATGSVWTVQTEVTIGAGAPGQVQAVLVAEDTGPVAASGVGWTILDTVVGWDGVGEDADGNPVGTVTQTLVGTNLETDAELRARLAREIYRRGQGPQAALRAAISEVTGVTYIGVWESQAALANDTDSDGIPARSVNNVVEGGDDDEVAAAIYSARGGGILMFGLPGGTLVSKTITASNGSPVPIGYNRVDDIDMWIEYTITTSTSEGDAPAGVVALVDAILLAAAATLFDVGDDVLPWQLEGAVHAEAIPGIDDVQVTLSLDDGSGDPYTRAKRAIAIRERAAFDAARISGSEV